MVSIKFLSRVFLFEVTIHLSQNRADLINWVCMLIEILVGLISGFLNIFINIRYYIIYFFIRQQKGLLSSPLFNLMNTALLGLLIQRASHNDTHFFQ